MQDPKTNQSNPTFLLTNQERNNYTNSAPVIACHQLHVFPPLALVTCFPALDTGYMFSCAWHWLHVFPRLALVTCFPALDTDYMFSRAWHWLHVFPRLAPVTCFPALGTGYMFSRSWHGSHVFPRSKTATLTSDSDWFQTWFELLLLFVEGNKGSI